MDDDGEWIKTAKEAPAVPDDAALPTPDDLAYVVMRCGTGSRLLQQILSVPAAYISCYCIDYEIERQRSEQKDGRS